MSTTNTPPAIEYAAPAPRRWYEGMGGYHWWVLVIGALAWLFDTMDQRIFILARGPALSQLLGVPPTHPDVVFYGRVVTALMMLGWAVGGVFFGTLGDRKGRVKALWMSVLVYSSFTGLSGLSQHWYDFCAYRFLMGCGIGGAFATAATLIAETLPGHSRAFALGMFQALSAVGNIIGSAVALLLIPPSSTQHLFGSEFGGWRILFFIGVLPALLVVPIMRTLREPEAWLKTRAAAQAAGEKDESKIAGILSHPIWRRNLFVGVTLAVAGVVGLWGVGFWTPELIREALGTAPTAKKDAVISLATLLQDVGAFFGMFAFTILATRLGRRLSFGVSFLAAWTTVTFVFLSLSSESQAYWMAPLVGFTTLSVFGGYAIYFPEIFPARLRSTGTGLCYNSARVFTAAILFLSNPMLSFSKQLGFSSPFRASTIALASIFFIGLLALIWAPETKDKPLPEDTPAPGNASSPKGGSRNA